ncbi:MAG: hypothetical protein AAGG01_22940, partial [Planctomycetota bacterium]
MILSSLVAAPLLSAAFTSHLSEPLRSPGGAGATAVGGLQSALDTISAEEIRSDLYFIASDAMKGRDSPSPQLKIAARYIRGRLMRFGFEPGAQDDSYFYEWSYPQTGLNEEKTFLKVAGPGGMTLDLKLGSDYFMGQRSYGMRTATGASVWGGVFDKKQLADLDVKGKWVVGVNDKGISGKRTRDLADAGALGVIVIPGEKNTKPVAEAYGGTAEMMARTSLGGGRAPRGDAFPVLHLNERVAGSLMAAMPNKLKVGDSTGFSFDESCARGFPIENICTIFCQVSFMVTRGQNMPP